MAERREEPGLLRALVTGLLVCGVCAAVLTATVVVLRPLQAANQQREREARIRELGLGALLEGGDEVELELRAVELGSGEYARVDAEALVEAKRVKGEPLPAERDLAGVGVRPQHAPVWLVREGQALRMLILPVRGRGYLSMMHGYLALSPDGNTVRGLVFTQHEETPGLGAEIESPEWQSRWIGKRLRGPSGVIRIRVVKEAPGDPAHDVHGITGATRTGDGVTAMVRFWVGPDGFGPFLERIARETSS